MQRLNRAVIHKGHAYPAGTVRDAAAGDPDGPWWDGTAAVQGEGEDGDQSPVEPPRTGRGSGAEAWREYAASIGVEHDDDATRDDIIDAVDAARV